MPDDDGQLARCGYRRDLLPTPILNAHEECSEGSSIRSGGPRRLY